VPGSSIWYDSKKADAGWFRVIWSIYVHQLY
jgi:hypothetical protein